MGSSISKEEFFTAIVKNAIGYHKKFSLPDISHSVRKGKPDYSAVPHFLQ